VIDPPDTLGRGDFLERASSASCRLYTERATADAAAIFYFTQMSRSEPKSAHTFITAEGSDRARDCSKVSTMWRESTSFVERWNAEGSPSHQHYALCFCMIGTTSDRYPRRTVEFHARDNPRNQKRSLPSSSISSIVQLLTECLRAFYRDRNASSSP